MSPDELRAKLAELTDARSSAERELEALRGHRERIQRLERNRDALLEEFPAEAPERLEQLTGEQRNWLYRTLKLEVRPTKDGYEVMGPFCTLELTRSSEGLGISRLTTTKTARLTSVPQIMGVFANNPSRIIKITTTTLPATM